jgi:phosphopantothenoylcysteine synthetase/decarboxylase
LQQLRHQHSRGLPKKQATEAISGGDVGDKPNFRSERIDEDDDDDEDEDEDGDDDHDDDADVDADADTDADDVKFA